VVLGGQTLSLATGGQGIVVVESNTGTGTETGGGLKTVGTVPVAPAAFTGGVGRNWGMRWEALFGVMGVGLVV
jgi:hypothetical protein